MAPSKAWQSRIEELQHNIISTATQNSRTRQHSDTHKRQHTHSREHCGKCCITISHTDTTRVGTLLHRDLTLKPREQHNTRTPTHLPGRHQTAPRWPAKTWVASMVSQRGQQCLQHSHHRWQQRSSQHQLQPCRVHLQSSRAVGPRALSTRTFRYTSLLKQQQSSQQQQPQPANSTNHSRN